MIICAGYANEIRKLLVDYNYYKSYKTYHDNVMYKLTNFHTTIISMTHTFVNNQSCAENS